MPRAELYVPPLHDKHGTATAFQTALYILKICTGAGLLGVPFAMQQAGLVAGTIIILAVSALNAASSRILLHCKESVLRYAPSLPPSSTHQPRDTFASLAFLTLGQWGVHLVHLSIVLTLCGAVSLYIITINTIATQLFPHLSSLLVLVALFVLLLPFSLIHDLSFLSFASALGTLAYLVSFVLIFIYAIIGGTSDRQHQFTLTTDSLLPVSVVDVLSTFGVLSFSLGVPVLTFMLQESMAQPERFARVMDSTMAAVFVLLTVIGVLGVALFGTVSLTHSNVSPSIHHHSSSSTATTLQTHQVRPIILSNLDASSYMSLAVQLLISITLLLTAPLSLAPALNLLQSIAFGSPDVAAVNGREDDERRRLLQYERERERASIAPGGQYGGLLDPHDLYNQSSDEEDDTEALHHHNHNTRNGNGGGKKRDTILVRGKVLSISSLDSLVTHPNSATLPPPSSSSSAAYHSTPPSPARSLSARFGWSSSVLWVAGLRVLVLLCIVLVAFSVPCFTVIMSSIGLLTLSILCFLLPPIFYLRLQRMGWVSVEEETGGWYATYCYAFLGVGVLCMLAGVVVVSQMRCE